MFFGRYLRNFSDEHCFIDCHAAANIVKSILKIALPGGMFLFLLAFLLAGKSSFAASSANSQARMAAKAYRHVINKLAAEYGEVQKITKKDYSDDGSAQTKDYYYGLCGGYVTDLGGSSVPELIVAVSRKAQKDYGIDNSEIFVYSFKGGRAFKVGEMRVLASGNGRSWPEFFLHEANGKGYLEERWTYLPSFNWETNEPEGSTVSESKFYSFSGSKLVEVDKPSYEGLTVLIGSFDNILIGNLAELRTKLKRLVSCNMAF